jgi:hypothetical protein
MAIQNRQHPEMSPVDQAFTSQAFIISSAPLSRETIGQFAGGDE